MQPPHTDPAHLFLELGCATIGLALLARLANRWRFSAIPLYLLAGLAFGTGGIEPLHLSGGFIHVGAEIGVLLLLFMLGLEYTGAELAHQLRTGIGAGLADLLLNLTPGLIAGFVLGWGLLPSLVLGGVTYISSSGIIAKVVGEMGRMSNPETSSILSILVLEDLAMALYLPLVGALLSGGSLGAMAGAICLAVGVVFFALFVAVRFGSKISSFAAHESEEIILLTVFGTVLLVAGITERFGVSAAIGAFLVGIAASGSIAQQSHRLFAPLRDLFAAIFFFFFGLQIDPASLPPELVPAAVLAAVTAATKIATGFWATRKAGVDVRRRVWAGTALVARGEFSIVIAGLGVALQPRLGPLSAAYVLILAIVGPFLARVAN